MASQGCKDELNAQLQALDARLKSAEKNIGVLAKGVASVASGSYSPSFDDIGAAFKAAATLKGQEFSDQFAAITSLVPSSLGDAMTGLAIQMAMQQLGKATITLDQMNSAINQMNGIVNSVQNLLSIELARIPQNLLEITRLQGALDEAHNALDSGLGMMNTINNISACKSKSLIMGS